MVRERLLVTGGRGGHRLRAWLLALIFIMGAMGTGRSSAQAPQPSSRDDAPLTAREQRGQRLSLQRAATEFLRARREVVMRCGRCRGVGAVVRDRMTGQGLQSVRVTCGQCAGKCVVVRRRALASIHALLGPSGGEGLFGKPLTYSAACELLRKGRQAEVEARTGYIQGGRSGQAKVLRVWRQEGRILGAVALAVRPERSTWVRARGGWRFLNASTELDVCREPSRGGAGRVEDEEIVKAADRAAPKRLLRAARSWIRARSFAIQTCARCNGKGAADGDPCASCGGGKRVLNRSFFAHLTRPLTREPDGRFRAPWGRLPLAGQIETALRAGAETRVAQLEAQLGFLARPGKLVSAERVEEGLFKVQFSAAPHHTLWRLGRRGWRLVSVP